MKKRKGKTKRWLAGILSAVLVIGSINLVDALEGSNGESALYDAPELTITQGATDYDLMKDITYDSSMYELAVVNDGGFDVNTVGDYEVTYSLTSKDDGTLEPGDSGDASNSDNENKDQNSGDNQGGDNTQTGDNSDNAGSDNGSDSSDSSNGGDSADAGQGDTGSDSSNAEDSMDAGQGDTNSDSSNAGDSTDAGQGDTNSDSSNAEDTADAVSGEDAAQSEENTGDTGVLGVSRPRTGVDMSYQSEPVGAEAVDVTKGDDTNTVDTQEKQVITFTRTVHVAAASEDKEPVYVARELVLTQGEEDYDLTDDILYDDVKYTLEVVELGGFDINKIGSYEVTYSLTPVTTEGTQENGQDDTQENQVITFQRTVTVKAAVEETGEFEVPELYLEQGQEDYDLAAGLVYDENKYKLNIKDDGNFDIMLSGEYKVTFVLNPLEENPDSENNTGDADTSDPDQTDGDQSEKVLGATRSMDSSAENADDKTENKNTEDNNTEDNNTKDNNTEDNNTEDNNTENDNVEDKKEENDNTANTDQAEDTFVIPDGITTFTRRVVVTPGIALLSAGNTINHNYPWCVNMNQNDDWIILEAPKDDTYVGTPVLQWTKEANLGKADITDNSWENVPGVTVIDKKVTLTGASRVDGKWYRFKFSDDDYSEAVRIVYLDTSNPYDKKIYKGNQKIPADTRGNVSSWYISNDEVMYATGYQQFVGEGNFDVWFYYNGAWNASSYDGQWFTLTESSADTPRGYMEYNNKKSPIRFYFEGSTIFLNIKPVDKAYSICTDICLGVGTYTGTYYDRLNMRATDNRKTHQFDFVGKQPNDPYQPDQLTLVVKSHTDLCKWAAASYDDRNFFVSNPITESSQDAGISLSWENQTDILLSFTLTTLEKSHIVTDNVKFESGNGTFTETGKKEYVFYDNEVLGTQQVYPPVINNNKVIEKIPGVKPNDNNEKFQGWKLAVSGTPDGDIDINKLYSDDEVAALKYKDAYGIMTFTAQYGEEQAQIFTGGTTAAQKYASVEQALKDAASGDTVKIIKAGKITPTTADGVEAAKDVTLEHYNDATRFYKTTVSSKIAVDEDSVVTLMDGKLELSANASVKVLNPTDGQTYQVTAPDCTSWVTVDDKDKGDSPYFMGDADGSVKIDAVTYSYQNPDQDNLAMVYIPQGMKNNDQVTKAEVAADQAVTIEVDNTNSVVLNGSGNAGDTVTVERRTTDSKVDVKLPSGAQGTIFGHAVGAAPAGGVTVSQRSAENAGYPDRDYITIANAGDAATINGFTYTSQNANEKLYLGTFNVAVTTGNNAEISGGAKPADPGYLQQYKVKISPKTHFDLDKDNFTVTMKKSDTGAAETLPFVQVCKEETDGSITVTIPQVTGDITIHAEAKRQTSKLTINGLDGRGIVKVLDGEGKVHELKQGKDSVTVNRNEELTLTFIPDDFTEPYYDDLTGEKGSSFSILTALKDNTPGAATNLFTQDVKDSFDWTEKSYQVKYTPNKAENTLEATFTHSSIMHVHVTGGTAEVNTAGLVQNPTDTGSFRHVIVPDNTSVQVTLKDTSGHNPVHKAAYWKHTSTAGGNDIGTDVTSQLNDAGNNTYTYTTQAVRESHMLNVSFEQGQYVEITFPGGNASLVDTGAVNWKDQGNHTYQTLVKNGDTLTMKVQAKEGYGLKSITVNGFNINATEALKNPEYNVTYDKATRTYTHTTKPIYQAWKVVMDFEEQYTVSFVDQKDRELDTIPAVNGTTIPEEKFTEMQAITDALKGGNETFLTWVDKADENTAYNKNTIITKNNLVLKPVYRKNAGNGGHIENGSDGSILAADDFAIHLRDLHNLTVDNVKDEKYANVTAFDKDGAKVTAQVTVDADELAALKATGAGTHRDALTFTYNNLSVKVTVEISDAEVTITGRTAHTLTFTGKGGVTYQVQKSDENGGSLTGNVMSAATAAGTGKGTADGLDKAAYYLISHKAYGQAVGRTSLVDAQDIAKQFADDGDQTTTNGNTDKTEKASNNNVDVTVDDNGNYKVTLKKDIDHTVEIPDTWENVKIDLGGHTITGDNADDNNEAKPGLVFKKDDTTTEHPGTNLEIVNGTIQGGSGSAVHPDGAAGVGEAAVSKPSQAGITVGANAVIKGGNGADGENGSNGGNGGSGIEGTIGTTVNGGSVSGGNGGKGSDSATGTPGNGGNGGSGIKTDKDVVINGGTITGGNAGNGGNATGDNNTNPGGSGGNGGSGVNSGSGKIDNNGGTITGGDAGNGGSSEKGNGGTGGNGGSGSIGETNNTNGGTTTGGNGGNGGNSNNGGNNGNGGSGGKGTEGTVNGGNQDGGNGKDGETFFVIFFKDQKQNLLNAADPCKVAANGKITKDYFDKMQEKTDAQAKADEKFFAWTEENHADKVYTAETEITASVTLVPVYRADSNVVPGQDGNTIAADNFSIRIEKVSSLTETEAKKLANVKAYDKKGTDITNTVTVDQNKLTALQQSTAGIHPDALTFEIPGSVTVSVTVEITDDNPVITGKTAHTLTFKGRANETYEYQELDAQGTPTGNVLTILTDGDGKATVTGLKKATPYQISHKKYGSVNGKTALVDAKDIAKQFEDRGAGDTTGNEVLY